MSKRKNEEMIPYGSQSEHWNKDIESKKDSRCLNCQVREEKEKWKEYALKVDEIRKTEHQKWLSTEGMFDDLNNEINALLRKETLAAQIALSELLSDYGAHSDIQDIVKNRNPQKQLKFTWIMGITIIAIVVLWQLATNVELRTWVGERLFAIGVIIVGAGIVFYLIKNNQNRGKKR